MATVPGRGVAAVVSRRRVRGGVVLGRGRGRRGVERGRHPVGAAAATEAQAAERRRGAAQATLVRGRRRAAQSIKQSTGLYAFARWQTTTGR